MKHVNHANNTYKEYNIKNLGEYHYLYVQSNKLFLADVFNNFQKACLKIFEHDPVHFISTPGLAWQACLKRLNIQLDLLTDIDILSMVEKEIRQNMSYNQKTCKSQQEIHKKL